MLAKAASIERTITEAWLEVDQFFNIDVNKFPALALSIVLAGRGQRPPSTSLPRLLNARFSRYNQKIE